MAFFRFLLNKDPWVKSHKMTCVHASHKKPCVVPIGQVKFDEDTVTAVVRARAGLHKRAHVELDVSTDGDLQTTTVALATTFIQDYAQMADTCCQLAEIMEVNRTSALGVNKAGAKTDRHQHAPMGVLNVATGKKLWRFWRPGATKDCAPDLVLTVRAGEMLWFLLSS